MRFRSWSKVASCCCLLGQFPAPLVPLWLQSAEGREGVGALLQPGGPLAALAAAATAAAVGGEADCGLVQGHAGRGKAAAAPVSHRSIQVILLFVQAQNIALNQLSHGQEQGGAVQQSQYLGKCLFHVTYWWNFENKTNVMSCHPIEFQLK